MSKRIEAKITCPARLFEMLRNKTDKGLTETFYFLDNYGMGIILFVLLIFFIASLTFIK
jgi:hypothetical protein